MSFDVLIEDGAVVVECMGFRVGDHVKVGKGTTLWRIAEFGRFGDGGAPYADLKPVEGYSNLTACVDRLRLIERP